MKINIKILYKYIPSHLVDVARHAQNTLNDKSVIYLQYLKKEGRILHAINIKLSYKLILSILIWSAISKVPNITI